MNRQKLSILVILGLVTALAGAYTFSSISSTGDVTIVEPDDAPEDASDEDDEESGDEGNAVEFVDGGVDREADFQGIDVEPGESFEDSFTIESREDGSSTVEFEGSDDPSIERTYFVEGDQVGAEAIEFDSTLDITVEFEVDEDVEEFGDVEITTTLNPIE